MNQSKFELIASYLHFNGEKSKDLSKEEHDRLFSMADGYGNLTVEQLHAKSLTWDWSHIRDSSEEALESIHRALTRILRKKRGVKRLAFIVRVTVTYPAETKLNPKFKSVLQDILDEEVNSFGLLCEAIDGLDLEKHETGEDAYIELEVQ